MQLTEVRLWVTSVLVVEKYHDYMSVKVLSHPGHSIRSKVSLMQLDSGLWTLLSPVA